MNLISSTGLSFVTPYLLVASPNRSDVRRTSYHTGKVRATGKSLIAAENTNPPLDSKTAVSLLGVARGCRNQRGSGLIRGGGCGGRQSAAGSAGEPHRESGRMRGWGSQRRAGPTDTARGCGYRVHVKSREFIGVQRLKPLKRCGNGWTSGTPEGVP